MTSLTVKLKDRFKIWRIRIVHDKSANAAIAVQKRVLSR
jgi:hypothetical protein